MIERTAQYEQTADGEANREKCVYEHPPALPDKGRIPLPDDREYGWGNVDGSVPGELLHVGLFVKPDMAIDRVAALGACVYAEAHDEYITIGEVIDAVPDDSALATAVEAELFEQFLKQLFDAIETVATAIGDPQETVVHCYTYSDHEAEFLAEGLDRHTDTLPEARAMRDLCSLHPNGHTDVDQSMISPVQPIITDHFALGYPSQGLLAVADQFVPGWTIESFDPIHKLKDRPDYYPLRNIFSEQFVDESVAYDTPDGDPGIRLDLGSGRAVSSGRDDDRYPIRKRTGGQFPLEYIWAMTPRRPEDTTPRLTPSTAAEWADDPADQERLRETISQYYYRKSDQEEPVQRGDVRCLVERLSYTLVRLVESIPFKDAYHPKEPIDVTTLADFELPVTELPAAARDYLRIEFGNQREQTVAHYRHPLRDRARNGRSMPIRCTDIERNADGSLTVTAQLAYDALYSDEETARQIARQTRLRDSDGPGSGSWRVLTRLQAADSDSQVGTDSTATATATPTTTPTGALTVEDAADIKHSPPVLVDGFDTEAGTITLLTFAHQFKSNYSEFRVDHCGWESPIGSNLDNQTPPPVDDADQYVADREPVWIEPGEVYMLDPMVDDFGSRKADYALQANTVSHNALWQHLQTVQTGSEPHPDAEPVVDPAGIEAFLDRLDESEECLGPNKEQKSFIRAVDSQLVSLHGPPGTGKTSGAMAPGLLGRAFARAQHDESFVSIVVAPSHEAVDAVLDGTTTMLDEWRRTVDGLTDVQLVRILPSTPPAADERVDDEKSTVDVTYANYHSREGTATLEKLATDIFDSTAASQQLLFATPATVYRTLEIIAETRDEIDGDSAPAAMRYPAGLVDVVCVDEASMMDIPQWLLAGSVLKPTGQTLVVGDPHQLATVTATEWADTLRKPLEETKAYLSAMEYVHWLDDTVSTDDGDNDVAHRPSTDGGPDHTDIQNPPIGQSTEWQSTLSGFVRADPAGHNGGDTE